MSGDYFSYSLACDEKKSASQREEEWVTQVFVIEEINMPLSRDERS